MNSLWVFSLISGPVWFQRGTSPSSYCVCSIVHLDVHSVFNSLEDFFKMPASISQETGRSGESIFLLRFPNSSAIFWWVLPTLAKLWANSTAVRTTPQSQSSHWRARQWIRSLESATLWGFRRQNVVTVVYKGCHHRYTFARKTWSLWVGGLQDGRSSSQTAPHGPSQQVGDGMCQETGRLFLKDLKDIPEKWRLWWCQSDIDYNINVWVGSRKLIWNLSHPFHVWKTAASVNLHKLCTLDHFNC